MTIKIKPTMFSDPDNDHKSMKLIGSGWTTLVYEIDQQKVLQYTFDAVKVEVYERLGLLKDHFYLDDIYVWGYRYGFGDHRYHRVLNELPIHRMITNRLNPMTNGKKLNRIRKQIRGISSYNNPDYFPRLQEAFQDCPEFDTVFTLAMDWGYDRVFCDNKVSNFMQLDGVIYPIDLLLSYDVYRICEQYQRLPKDMR